MRLDELYLWYLGNPDAPRYVGALKLVAAGKGVSLHYGREWLNNGFALSEDLPLVDMEHLPPGRLEADAQRAVGAVDDARPDRWGEKVIRFVDKPKRLSLMEYLYYAGDDRFGALGVSTSSSSYSPREVSPLPRLEDVQQLSEVVAKIEAAEPITVLEARMIAGGGSPLGGAKPKALIDIDGDSTLEHAMSQCDAFGLLPTEAASEVLAVIEVVNTWQAHFTQAGVIRRDIQSLAERIDGEELLAQRKGFDPARFESAPGKRTRTSPFRRT